MGIDFRANLACGCLVTMKELNDAEVDDIEDFCDRIGCSYETGGGEFTDEEIYYVLCSSRSKVKNDGSVGVSGIHNDAEAMDIANIASELRTANIPFKGPGFFAILFAF